MRSKNRGGRIEKSFDAKAAKRANKMERQMTLGVMIIFLCCNDGGRVDGVIK